MAITPAGVAAFVAHGHDVVVQTRAWTGSAITDQAYRNAGGTIVEEAGEVWERAALILKVKESLDEEISQMRAGQVLFTYLHLAASKRLTTGLLEREVVGIGYETVQLEDGTLPLLVPMSEVAGRLSIQAGAKSLEMISGVRGSCCLGYRVFAAGGSRSSERESWGSTPAWWAWVSERTSASSISTHYGSARSGTSCRGMSPRSCRTRPTSRSRWPLPSLSSVGC